MFSAIKRLTGGKLEPKVYMVDFEVAAHNAVTAIFPDVILKCCRFHLGQN